MTSIADGHFACTRSRVANFNARAALSVAILILGLHVTARADGITWTWASIFPAGNHYGWGSQDSSGNSNWTANAPSQSFNFPYQFGDVANFTQTLGTDEFIDLVYNPAGGSSAALNANLTRLVLDAGNQGHSYTIEQSSFGGSLTFGADAVTGPATIVVGNDAGNDVISAPIFMTTALHITGNKLLISGSIGSGTIFNDSNLTLTGSNEIDTINLNSGTLNVSSDSNLGTPSGLLHFQGGTLHPTGSFSTTHDVTFAAVGGNTIQLDPAITLTLAGNRFDGSNPSGNGTLLVTGGGTLVLQPGSFNQPGNPLLGNLYVSSSTLTIGNNVALSDSSANVILDGATVHAATYLTADAHITLQPAGATFDIDGGTNLSNGTSLTLTGAITGPGGFTKNGTGMLTLSGTNTFGGIGTISNGTLELTGNAGNIQLTTNGAYSLFNQVQPQTIFANSASAGTATIVTNGGGTNLITFQDPGVTIFTDDSTLGAATIITNGSPSTGFGGYTELMFRATGGTARVITNASPNDGGTAGTFDISDLLLPGVTVGSIEGDGYFVLGGKTLTFGSRNTNTAVNGIIGDSGFWGGSVGGGTGGSIVKVGSGVTGLNGINTYTGTTTVNGGILDITGSIASNSSATVNAGGTLSFIASSSAGAPPIYVNGGITLNSGLAGALNFVESSSAATATVTTNGGSALNAAGGLTTFGDAFGGTPTAANATLITNGGTNGGFGGITAFTGHATGGSARVVTNAGGVFDISQTSLTGVTIGSIEGAGSYQLGSKTLGFGSLNTDTTVSGVISDGGIAGGTGGGIIKYGSGTTILSGINTYTGPTTIAGGILRVTGSIASSSAILQNGGHLRVGFPLGSTVPVTANAGSTFDMSELSSPGMTVGSIEGAGSFQLGSKMLTFGSLNTDTVVSGTISDGGAGGGMGGSLMKIGSGMTTLSANNTYTGTTTVGTGVLQINGGATYPNSATTVDDGASLFFVNANAASAFFDNMPGTTGGQTKFMSGSSAAHGTFINHGGMSGGMSSRGSSDGSGADPGGQTILSGGATAGNGTFNNLGADANGALSGSTTLTDSGTTGASGTFTNFPGTTSGAAGGFTLIVSGASGGTSSATFTSYGAAVPGALAGSTTLGGSGTTAGSAAYFANGSTIAGGAGGQTVFNAGATAASANLTANGATVASAGDGATIFNDGSTIAAATLVTNGGTNGGGGGLTETIGNVIGGTSRVVTNAGGAFDISQLTVGGITVGSIEGAGLFKLGGKTVTVGTPGSNTVVSGIIADGGLGGGTGASLVKLGAGALALSGANTYTGGTTLQAGTLGINGPSAIGTGPFSISGGSIDNTSAGPLSLTTNNPQSWFGTFAFAGTQSLNLGPGLVTLNSNPIVTVSANTLTVAPIGNGTGNSLTKAGGGTLYVSGGASYTGTTSVNGGTMTIAVGPFASSSSTIAPAAVMSFVAGANAGSGTFNDQSTSVAATPGGLIQFADNGTSAGSGVYTVNGGFTTNGNSTLAGNGATISFASGATADHGTINVNGATSRYATSSAQALFNTGSSAGNAMIATSGGIDSFNAGPAPGGFTLFSGNATAGAATLITNAGSLGGLPGLTEFKDTANAGTANLTINYGTLNKFFNSASASGATLAVNGGGTVDFENNATAGTATFTIASNGLATFINSALGGSATMTNNAGGRLEFHDTAGAATANITNQDARGGQGTAYTRFFDTSSAGTASITNRGGQEQDHIGGGRTEFHDSSSAASAVVSNLGATDSNGAFGGETDFYDGSNAGTSATAPAVIINGGSTAGGTNGFGGSGGVTQFFSSPAGASTAGTAQIVNNPAADNGHNGQGGYTYFNGGTSADHATITNNGSLFNSSNGFTAGHTVFNSGSTAANSKLIANGALASIGHGGEIDFTAGSTAANATIINDGATVSGAAGGTVAFSGVTGNIASAGNAMITANGGAVSGASGGSVYFGGYSTAANATTMANGGTASGALGGTVYFIDDAGAATLIANGGKNGGGNGLIRFSSGGGFTASGGTARVVINSGGVFDKSDIGPLSVGSIEGAGRFQLGGNTLTTGSLNTDTSVSGLLVDGGISGGGGANVTKVGTGTLTLNGANTYSGATTVNGGTLSTILLADGGVASGLGTSTNAAADLVINGATLQYTGPATSTNRLFTLGASGGGLDASGSGPLTFSNPGAIAFSGSGPRTLTLTGTSTATNTILPVVADGPGGATSLTKTGAGTWVLNTLNTYSGPTTITAGTLRYGGSDSGPSTNVQAYALNPPPIPNKSTNAAVGLDFDVTSTITITQLGVFDDGKDGLANSHNAYIYNRNTQAALATVNIGAGSTGTLSADGYRFVPLSSPLTLTVGNYSVVADYSGSDKFLYAGPSDANLGVMNSGGGVISYIGQGRIGSVGSYPTSIEFLGPVYRYGGGSFLFNSPGSSRIPGDVIINGPTAVLDLGINQNGNVGTVTLDGGGSITGTGTSRLTSRTSFQMKSGTVTAILAGTGIPLLKTTTGTVTLSGANTYSGDTTVSAGTLRFNIVSASPTIASGVTATVAAGATLELAGSVSALGTVGGNREHIVNNSLGAAGAPAGLVVSGQNQIVGAIDGSGTTSVAAAGDLQADHIVQVALIIGGAAGSPGLVTIDASDATGHPLDSARGGPLADSTADGLSKRSSADPIDSLSPSGPFAAGNASSPALINIAADGSDLAVPAISNSVAYDTASPVPEPSTLLMALLALLGLVCTHFVRHDFRCQTV